MKEKVRHIIRTLHPRRTPEIIAMFLKDETISGKLILVATIFALLVVNSPLYGAYEHFWHLKFGFNIGGWGLAMDLRHWVNEGFMAVFFLVVGLEIKRELVHGELREFKKAMLPIGAAVGGMLLPAILYVLINPHPETIKGWGIPIATDIAFALAVLALLGHRVPLSLKTFLLTLAIADDIGAIIIIALFYAEIIHYGYLAASVILLIGLWVIRKRLSRNMALFLALGAVLWITTHKSGIHASIVGTAIGLLAPVSAKPNRRLISEQLEKTSLPISTFIVLPVFAFANAGVVLSMRAFENPVSLQVMAGIILGLVYGKVIGIVGASWLLVKFAGAELPQFTTWRHIMGVGLIAGIGFTVSIFITELAFGSNAQLIEAAKISIFIASGISAVLGAALLLTAKKRLV